MYQCSWPRRRSAKVLTITNYRFAVWFSRQVPLCPINKHLPVRINDWRALCLPVRRIKLVRCG